MKRRGNMWASATIRLPWRASPRHGSRFQAQASTEAASGRPDQLLEQETLPYPSSSAARRRLQEGAANGSRYHLLCSFGGLPVLIGPVLTSLCTEVWLSATHPVSLKHSRSPMDCFAKSRRLGHIPVDIAGLDPSYERVSSVQANTDVEGPSRSHLTPFRPLSSGRGGMTESKVIARKSDPGTRALIIVKVIWNL